MLYLKSFSFPSESDEANFILSYPPQLEMQCYQNNNVYPFKLFPQKKLSRISFEPLTLLYGNNGSGKSTILNIIAEKLGILRSAPFNYAPCLPDYLAFTEYTLSDRCASVPRQSRIITSDEVFDFLLDVRETNKEIDERREELFSEYKKIKFELYAQNQFSSLDDYEDLKRRNEAKRKTKSQYTAKRIPKELVGKSNGESAYLYFTKKITENALYLLDEPENSLSAELQLELVKFIEDSARFFGCQFIISTHSPFILSMKDAKIYDLDSLPVAEKSWTELKNVRTYFDFFLSHAKEFE